MSTPITQKSQIPAKTSVVAPTQEQKQIDSLLSVNAYKNAAGMLMQVLSQIQQKEMDYRKLSGKMASDVANAGSDAADVQGSLAVDGAMSEAVNEGVGATMNTGAAVRGVVSIKQGAAIDEKYTTKINTIDEELKNQNSPRGIGVHPNPPTAEHIAMLKQNREDLVEKRKQELQEHHSATENTRGLKDVVMSFSKVTSALTQGQTQAGSAAAKNAQELVQQAAGNVESNSKTDTDVASMAQSIKPGDIAVASVRG